MSTEVRNEPSERMVGMNRGGVAQYGLKVGDPDSAEISILTLFKASLYSINVNLAKILLNPDKIYYLIRFKFSSRPEKFCKDFEVKLYVICPSYYLLEFFFLCR